MVGTDVNSRSVSLKIKCSSVSYKLCNSGKITSLQFSRVHRIIE